MAEDAVFIKEQSSAAHVRKEKIVVLDSFTSQQQQHNFVFFRYFFKLEISKIKSILSLCRLIRGWIIGLHLCRVHYTNPFLLARTIGTVIARRSTEKSLFLSTNNCQFKLTLLKEFCNKMAERCSRIQFVTVTAISARLIISICIIVM